MAFPEAVFQGFGGFTPQVMAAAAGVPSGPLPVFRPPVAQAQLPASDGASDSVIVGPQTSARGLAVRARVRPEVAAAFLVELGGDDSICSYLEGGGRPLATAFAFD